MVERKTGPSIQKLVKGNAQVHRQHGNRRMPSSAMLLRVALVKTDVLEERSAFIIRVTRI
jgi:hypothetical protein